MAGTGAGDEVWEKEEMAKDRVQKKKEGRKERSENKYYQEQNMNLTLKKSSIE